MKRKPTTSWLNRLFWLLMALHVLNLSVDPPDPRVHINRSGAVEEDLSINEMESVGEWVLEHVFGIAVAEHDEPDEEGKITQAFSKLLICHRLAYFLVPSSIGIELTSSFFRLFVALAYISQTADVSAPPPRCL